MWWSLGEDGRHGWVGVGVEVRWWVEGGEGGSEVSCQRWWWWWWYLVVVRVGVGVDVIWKALIHVFVVVV